MPKVQLLPVDDEPATDEPRKTVSSSHRSNLTMLLFLVGCLLLGAGIALGYDMVVSNRPSPRPHIDASTIRGSSFRDAPAPPAGVSADASDNSGTFTPEGGDDGVASDDRNRFADAFERTASGHLAIAFDDLANYNYTVPGWALLGGLKPEWDTSDDQIPDWIASLHGERVMLQGFMMPLNLEANRARSFLLVRSFADCCFGCLPTANEWVYVMLRGDKTTGVVNGLPITVYGTFEVGSTTDDEGYMFSLYRMIADEVIGAR